MEENFIRRAAIRISRIAIGLRSDLSDSRRPRELPAYVRKRCFTQPRNSSVADRNWTG